MTAEKALLRQTGAEFADAHRHHIGFAPRIDERQLLMRLHVIDIVNVGHDNALILHQIHRLRAVVDRRLGDALLLPDRFQLVKHGDDARFVIGLENIVKGFQLESLNRMIFPGGDKHNQRPLRELVNILRQQHAVQRRDIDIEKNDVDPMLLQIFQHLQAVVETGLDLYLAVLLDHPAQLLLRQKFVFDNNGFHCTLSATASGDSVSNSPLLLRVKAISVPGCSRVMSSP